MGGEIAWVVGPGGGCKGEVFMMDHILTIICYKYGFNYVYGKYIMIRRMCCQIGRYNFFFKKKKQNEGHESNNIDELLEKSQNLGYLVQNIKNANANKDFLLPPQKPQHKDKLTVVMELDEVLSFTFTPDEEAYLSAPFRKYDYYHEFDEYDALLSIYKRKNLDNFLNYVSEEWQPVIFSSGVRSYVELMLSYIDPHKKIQYILTQQHCDLIQKQQEEIDEYVKDLRLLGRDMDKVLYLDCKPFSYWMYPQNCYPLEEFRADYTMQSEDMNWIIMEMQKMRKQNNVVKYLTSRFNIREALEESKLL